MIKLTISEFLSSLLSKHKTNQQSIPDSKETSSVFYEFIEQIIQSQCRKQREQKMHHICASSQVVRTFNLMVSDNLQSL